MTELHPITPSPKLIEEWIELSRPRKDRSPNPNVLATYAARWGADQELEACCEHLQRSMSPRATIDYLRAARRPEPPSLAEEALGLLNEGPVSDLLDHEVAVICRALERLQELEGQDDG